MSAGEMRALTVSQVNNYIKMVVDGNPVLGNIYVRGEISNLTFHNSGHLFFSVKDEESRLAAMMFRREALSLNFRPENGMKVILHGRVSVFPRDGVYQLYVSGMEPDGVGSLTLAFEQLKKKLEREGLFEESRKKPLPKIPLTVGVVTSPTGAAVRDIINVTGRRFPLARVLLFPSLVQGEGAEENLIEGIRYFSEKRAADVVIIGRGGGSIEDLWAFNSEALAREIRRSAVPVISAVGHETDFTICDFVADRRAPTPSAAAEIAVPDREEIARKINNVATRLRTLLLQTAKHGRERLALLAGRRILTSPIEAIDGRRELLYSLQRDLERAVSLTLTDRRNRYRRLTDLLNAVSPLRVISKGYCAVFDAAGGPVKSVKSLKRGDRITLRVTDGLVGAEVRELRDFQEKRPSDGAGDLDPGEPREEREEGVPGKKNEPSRKNGRKGGEEPHE